ncbi:DciA family protein [Rodentibacter caecimuris]|uniref:DUF721 domain-containing protein n=1 Tax=Rodentibacter caecimuris TaxID=1796644 RepID=A0ABX3KYX9_9PAST|nr:hypothetical protein BKG89_01660 [Rodentibacter heylii]
MENKTQRYQRTMNVLDVMQSSPFAKILQKSLLINELNEQISGLFPKEIQGQFRLGQIHQQELFIEVSNAMVRQSILFRQSELLALIQQYHSNVEKLHIRINPEFHC